MLFSSAVVLLSLTMPAASAVSIETIEIAHEGLNYSGGGRVVAITSDGGGTVGSVTAQVESDAGSETVTLVESNAWLHGGAVVKSLPAKTGSATLTLFDSGNAVLATFTGTLGADGTVSLTGQSSTCASKTCDGTSDTKETTVDLEVLAAELFPATTGYDVTFDVVGADTYAVAYASFTVTEGTSTTKAEVDWDDIGAVWDAALTLDPDGLVQVKGKAYDTSGKKLETATVKLGVPWDDGGYGVNVLATDEDPLTTVGLISDQFHNGGTEDAVWVDGHLTFLSEGWSGTSTLPASAQVEITGGKTLTIPVNSYQVSAAPEVFTPSWGDLTGFDVSVNGNPGYFSLTRVGVYLLGADDLSVGTLVDNEDGTWTLSVAAYAKESGKLPKSVSVKITPVYEKGAASEETEAFDLEYEDGIAAVFANEVTYSQDPLGLDVSGKVSLLGAADKKGKTKTLAKGKFYATFTRDEDGDLALGGADKDLISAKGDILIGGEPIDFELTDANKDGVLEAPPVVLLRTSSNGKGTRVVTTTSTADPGLL